ncbi:unnamed protein product [Heligmosomoides polygyrus]|uniref:Uncharacterized protein n=1 Tax=Heligmosomoides polygyrus TaxID=6339 RepID=A0A183FY10_HELPZ|nr:unnamed protein product [Heligmosomoides polygyrus]
MSAYPAIQQLKPNRTYVTFDQTDGVRRTSLPGKQKMRLLEMKLSNDQQCSNGSNGSVRATLKLKASDSSDDRLALIVEL